MNYYFILTITLVIVFILITFLILKLVNATKEQTTGGVLIGAGLALIPSSFPTFSDKLFSLGEKVLINTTVSNTSDTNYISLLCGFVLILLGLYYNKNIRDRFFVLNILSKDKKLISDTQNVKDLKISDFKLREHQIDIVRMFNDANNITDESCKYIVDEIEEKTTVFSNQNKDFKKAYTGMASIPFTILAGTYLSVTEVDKYFEYNRNKSKYYALKTKKWYKKKGSYQSLNINISNSNTQSSEILVAISITRNVNDADLVQFNGKDIIKIELTHTKDNVIEYREQLDNYTKVIIEAIENFKSTYPNLDIVHLVGAMPSCLSIELGRKISLNRNRLPKIISYHYKYDNTPKYNFGIIVTETNKGKLIRA